MTIENTLQNIYTACTDYTQPYTGSKAYGITKVGDELIAKEIAKSDDVYYMIEELNNDKLHTNFDYVAISSTGWAAPLNEDGEVSGAPSKHPDRRRVVLTVAVDVSEKDILGSIIDFEDEDGLVFDENNATGMLAEAILRLVR